MTRNVHCPIIKVIRQKEFIYPACKECNKKLDTNKIYYKNNKKINYNTYNNYNEEYDINMRTELLLDKDFSNNIICNHCKVTCNILDLSYRYRLCLLISIDDDYLQKGNQNNSYY